MNQNEENEKFSECISTDLAYESHQQVKDRDLHNGIKVEEQKHESFEVSNIKVLNEEGAQALQKPVGEYITITSQRINDLGEKEFSDIKGYLSETITNLCSKLTNKNIDENFSVFVCGLGNCDITVDAIGPFTIRRLNATRHIKSFNKDIYDVIGRCEISAIAPGVLAQTGIETLEIIKGSAENVKPDLIIAIDSLAARSCDRLASTIQLSDNGINPGSGIGNNRKSINAESVGFPVLSIGIPTVVNSTTLVYDALKAAGINDIDERLKEILNTGKSFYVSPKESDDITEVSADLLSDAIDMALTIKK